MRFLNKQTLNEQIANETDLDPKKVAHATDFQFLFVAEKIRSGVFDKGVRLPYFGRFAINRKYLKYLENNLMHPKEVESWLSQIENYKGRVKVTKGRLKRLLETCLALYDQVGDGNPPSRAKLIKGGSK